MEAHLKKLENFLSSPVSYAEDVESTYFTNDMKFQRPEKPPDRRLSVFGKIQYEVLSSSMQEKKELNRLFFPIKVHNCCTAKTGKLLYSSTMLKTVLKYTQKEKILILEIPQKLYTIRYPKN